MSEQTIHPYERFTGTREWTVIDRAISELADNRDLEETTAHPYIVGYLCKALEEVRHEQPATAKRSREEVLAIVEAAREEFRLANPTGRNPLAELLAERREAAARGE